MLDKFKCSDPYFEEYLKFHAYDEDAKKISKTWGFMCERDMLGYVTIAMSHMEQGMHETLKMDAHGNVPAMLVGYLATRRDYERVGMGSCMMAWVMKRATRYSKGIGCRVVMLNPQDRRRRFLHKTRFCPRTGQRTERYVCRD